MSKLFEALQRGQSSVPDSIIQALSAEQVIESRELDPAMEVAPPVPAGAPIVPPPHPTVAAAAAIQAPPVGAPMVPPPHPTAAVGATIQAPPVGAPMVPPPHPTAAAVAATQAPPVGAPMVPPPHPTAAAVTTIQAPPVGAPIVPPQHPAADSGSTYARDNHNGIPHSRLVADDSEPARTLPLRLSVASPVFPFDRAKSFAGEQYRIARTKIFQLPSQPRMIVVSSAGPSDGKTITSINLAGTLSLKAGTSVLLIDGDFRRPSVHTRLGYPESPGLSEVLCGACSLADALIRCQEFPSLHVLCAGKLRSQPAELLDSVQWKDLAAQLRKSFSYIIVDCTPMEMLADFDLLSAVADGVVVVIRPDHSKRVPVLRALANVPKEKLIGVVLNDVENWFVTRLSHHQSHYYYAESE